METNINRSTETQKYDDNPMFYVLAVGIPLVAIIIITLRTLKKHK